MDFRYDINGLRGVAVLLVLLFHFGTPGFGGGFIGVDVFFVISGFLMTGIILRGLGRGSFSIGGFYRARLERLYPALLALVVGTLAFGAVAIEPVTFATMARDGISALAFVSNILFWRESGYFGAAPEAMWFLHSWSLSVEWQFYLVYPVVLVVLARFVQTPRAWLFVLTSGAIVSLALSVVAGQLVDSANVVSFGFYMLPTRAWEMLAGGLLAAIPMASSTMPTRLKISLSYLGLAAIALSVAFSSEQLAWPSWYALLPVAGTMAVLFAARSDGPLAVAPLQLAGRWSYSIYLWHWPVVAGFAYFDIEGGVAMAVGFVLSVVLGWASYRWVEQPALAWLRGASEGRRGNRSILLPLGAATGAIAAVAATVIASGGFPERSRPTDIYERSLIAAADYKYPLDRCGGVSTLKGNLRPCELGLSRGQDDAIVIGDSFAEMWYPRFAAKSERLNDHSVTFLTMGGCPPISGLRRVWPGMACEKFTDKAFAQAREPRYGTVVLAGMWTSYFTLDDANSMLCGDDGCVSSGSIDGLRRASAALTQAVKELRGLGKRVVVLTTSPYPDVNVPVELRKRAFAGEDAHAEWTFDFSQILGRSQPIDQVLRELRIAGAEIVDPVQKICVDSLCRAALDGLARYSDEAHLRSDYVAVEGDFLDDYLLDARRTAAR